MSVKTTGAEWNKYYSDDVFWPDGTWHDDHCVEVDGIEAEDLVNIQDSAKVVIVSGVVLSGSSDDDGVSLESHFKRWRKAIKTAFLSVEAPKELETAIRAAIIAAGGKIA